MFCRADRRPATEILSQGMIGLKVEPVLLALSVRFFSPQSEKRRINRQQSQRICYETD